MLPYGFHHGMYRDEDCGPTSKYRKITGKNRQEERRLLHKSERAKVKQQIKKDQYDI